MKVVVRGTNWIGDAVMTIPAMRELRRIFPSAHISLLTRSWAEGIFRDASFIDEIITIETNRSKLRSVLTQVKILREHSFDLAILFPNSIESAVAARLASIPLRFGYATEGRSFLLTNPIPKPEWKDQRHETAYYLNVIAAVEKLYLGSETIPGSDPNIGLEISPERHMRGRNLLNSFGIDTSRVTVALGSGSTNSRAKRWGAENFARLNDRLQQESGANVLLLGSADEADVARNVYQASSIKPFDLTGQTDLADAVAILSEVDMFVSNDMGLAHIAAAVGTKTIVIFGPTNPITTRPLGANVQIIRKDVECSPCMLRDCPIDHRCMTRISADKLFEKAKEMLKTLSPF